MTPPNRQVRAVFDDETLTVYQAFSPAIAIPAAFSGSFVGTPFKLDRMTWIKPSFLWMMYRSGWATKPGQEHILAIQITRAGFEEALACSTLSHYDPDIYSDHTTWDTRKQASPVRIQWDPERSITLEPLPWRSLQVGISGPAAHSYVHNWIVHIDDITPKVQEIYQNVAAGHLEAARAQCPTERPYPLTSNLAVSIGAS